MSNTTRAKWLRQVGLGLLAATVLATTAVVTAQPANPAPAAASVQQTLSPRQQSIAPIAAAMATGDMPQLTTALNQGSTPGSR
jgi:4-carboxymuconolactone decarboxylase